MKLIPFQPLAYEARTYFFLSYFTFGNVRRRWKLLEANRRLPRYIPGYLLLVAGKKRLTYQWSEVFMKLQGFSLNCGNLRFWRFPDAGHQIHSICTHKSYVSSLFLLWLIAVLLSCWDTILYCYNMYHSNPQGVALKEMEDQGCVVHALYSFPGLLVIFTSLCQEKPQIRLICH